MPIAGENILSPSKLAQQVTASRDVFRKCYDEFAASYPNARRFLTITALRQKDAPLPVGPDLHRADFQAALEEAQHNGFLASFVKAYSGRLFTSSATEVEASDLLDDEDGEETYRATLQKILDDFTPMTDAGTIREGMPRLARNTCKIVVKLTNGSFETGTGLLIGPRLVLTCWHVISSLVTFEAGLDGPEGAPDWPGVPIREFSSRLSIEFDFVARANQIEKKWTCGVTEDWLVAGSRLSADPSDSLDKWQPKQLDTFFDFAVIELNKPAGFDRLYYNLVNEPPREAKGKMIVSHHPGNYTMRFSPGEFRSNSAVRKFKDIAANGDRVLHSANTIHGSSGGACLTYDMKPAALHQFVYEVQQKTQGTMKPYATNVAIPLTKILQKAQGAIRSRMGSLSAPRCTLTSGKALIGRYSLQEAIASAQTPGGPKILVVQIHYGTDRQPLRQIGKSFSYEILDDALAPALHRLIPINASDIPDNAYSTAQLLLDKVTDKLSSKLTSPGQMAGAGESTEINDTIAVLARDVANLMEAGATRQTLWIAVNEMDKHPLSDTSTRVFFEKLYPEIAARQKLRLVLIGMSDPDMPALKNVNSKSIDPLKDHLNIEDVIAWVRNRLCSDPDRMLLSLGRIATMLADREMLDDREVIAQRERQARQMAVSRSAAIAKIVNDLFIPSTTL
ncbi:hypothetical protein XF30_10580 [Bradyrhizobium sp. SUTN9-2]|uniref:trypsin-like serine peptidase n=1 Tax=Bradyrhizobium sp. SUTN9-2 TaxID=1167456 RepID=UPI000D64CBA7|nr:trypsin-like peptidase domain-containing protein [Bradyrhizobium sp. SUTN9-2]PWE77158.1 hypothetical protein XF30_10580 [Bradyrhizobium sp. SUTN9-2]